MEDDLSPEIRKALEQQKANCIFCKIMSGEVQAKKVAEDDLVMAILDINPARPGHILLMPKEHYPIMAILPQHIQDRLFEMARLLCKAQKKAMVTHGSSIFIANGFPAGQQSQHFMVHLIPREPDDRMAFSALSGEEIGEAALKEIHAVLSNNIPLIIEKKLETAPKEWHKPRESGGQMVMGRNKVLQIIEQNPGLKELILKHPQEFLRECKTNPQLMSLFQAVDPAGIVEHYVPGALMRTNTIGADGRNGEVSTPREDSQHLPPDYSPKRDANPGPREGLKREGPSKEKKGEIKRKRRDEEDNSESTGREGKGSDDGNLDGDGKEGDVSLDDITRLL